MKNYLANVIARRAFFARRSNPLASQEIASGTVRPRNDSGKQEIASGSVRPRNDSGKQEIASAGEHRLAMTLGRLWLETTP